MHQQLCSHSWREGSAPGAARKTVHPDSPPALYKDTGKRASQPLYLDGLYWASCLCLLSCHPPPPPHGAAEISHQSHESDNDLGDNNRGEEKREGEKWGQDGGRMSREVVVRECFRSLLGFFTVSGSPSHISKYFPVRLCLHHPTSLHHPAAITLPSTSPPALTSNIQIYCSHVTLFPLLSGFFLGH